MKKKCTSTVGTKSNYTEHKFCEAVQIVKSCFLRVINKYGAYYKFITPLQSFEINFN